MGSAPASPGLHRLRQALAGLDPSLGPRLAETGQTLRLGLPAMDSALGGGLACGALHELAPVAPIHLAAATGFATALAALAGGSCGQVLWIATDFAANEAGGSYGPGLDRFGLAAARLIVLRVPRERDVLWAMEEGLRCRALACVIAELPDAAAADLTATRRLALAAREGTGVGLLLCYGVAAEPSAAATRWEVAAGTSRPDRFGGLGPTAFDLALVRNRRGPCGRWLVHWDHHERLFHAAVPLAVAETAFDRSDRTPSRRAG